MNNLCTICARAGSKGVPSKNIKKIAGKPLIQHTIEQAKKSKIFLAAPSAPTQSPPKWPTPTGGGGGVLVCFFVSCLVSL